MSRVTWPWNRPPASVADAQRVYTEMTADEKTGKPRSLPDLGQQSMAFELSKGEAHAYVRVGTVVVYVSEQGSHDDCKPAVLESLARMAATWAQQAQDGKTPARRLRSDPDRIRRPGRRSAAGPVSRTGVSSRRHGVS
ncbi:hypothetical protein [Streptomyces sp. NBC_01006]|uniref:hypothetical protein n=1 Tax=Streptomyces sp. NBC_01006 TaxID=2903716 RepID=UPI00386F02AD|nr:hypothetical protein OG509_39320 [Streptomyces sp. NBC_01006]